MDSFNIEEFRSPGNEYFPIYSWMWNEALDKDTIKSQIDEMYKRDIRGVYAVMLAAIFVFVRLVKKAGKYNTEV